MAYDPGNIFAKIIRGEIPAERIYDDAHVLAFKDIRPQAKVHILVLPKGQYVSMDDFSAKASADEIAAVTRAIGKIARDFDLDKTGYRLIANHGADSHQEVPHFHIHILGGQPLGKLVQPL